MKRTCLLYLTVFLSALLILTFAWQLAGAAKGQAAGDGCQFCHVSHPAKGKKLPEGLLTFKVPPPTKGAEKGKGKTLPVSKAKEADEKTVDAILCLDCHLQPQKSGPKPQAKTQTTTLAALVQYSPPKHKVHKGIRDVSCQVCHKDHKPLPPVTVEVKAADQHAQLSWSHSYTWFKEHGDQPAAPRLKLPAKAAKPGKAEVSTTSGVRLGYNVYRSASPNSGYEKLNQSILESNTFDDTAAAADKTYYYVVTTVSLPKEESKYSQAAKLSSSVAGTGEKAGNLTLRVKPATLEADGRGRAELHATLKDRLGKPLAERELEFLLGSAGDFKRDEVSGVVELASGKTDKKGVIEAVFMAGSVPQSVLFLVKDPQSGLKATAALRQWIELENSLTLEGEGDEPLKKGGLMEVKVTPAALPADGVSTAQIEVLIGERVKGQPKENAPRLTLWQGSGTLKTLDDSRAGRLTALYTAPTKPGRTVLAVKYGAAVKYVTINIRAHRAGDSSLVIKPETLPADARSKAEIIVMVKDEAGKAIFGAEVHLKLVKGGGRIIGKNEGTTDSFGQARFQYQAGHRAGEVVFKAKVISKAPENEDWQEAHFNKVNPGVTPASKSRPAAAAPERKGFPFQGPSVDRPVDRKQDFIFK